MTYDICSLQCRQKEISTKRFIRSRQFVVILVDKKKLRFSSILSVITYRCPNKAVLQKVVTED